MTALICVVIKSVLMGGASNLSWPAIASNAPSTHVTLLKEGSGIDGFCFELEALLNISINFLLLIYLRLT